MYNLVYLIGRLTVNPKESQTKNRSTVTLAVQRGYKNSDGIYETDLVKCVLWDGIASRTAEYCRKGDLIAVKGHLRTGSNETEVVVEKVSFLATNTKGHVKADDE